MCVRQTEKEREKERVLECKCVCECGECENFNMVWQYFNRG